MSNFKSIIKIFSYSLAIIGTTIGAGFVSGKEISNFFNVYGNFAYLMAVIMGIVYFLTLKLFFNCSTNNPFKNNKFLDYVIAFSQLISLTAMIAGLNSVLSNYFGSKILFYITCVLCFIIILCGLKGLTRTNALLMPILLVFILFVGVNAVLTHDNFDVEISSSSPLKILTYIFIYIGLDLFSCYPICIVLGKNTTKKERNIIAIIVSVAITILISCYLVSVLKKGTDYIYFDLPILNYTIDNFDSLYIFACIVLTIGIVTTLLSNGFVLYDFSNNRFHKNKFVVFLLLFCVAFILSFIGFSAIVEFFYPINGIIGLTLVVLLLIKTKKKYKTPR